MWWGGGLCLPPPPAALRRRLPPTTHRGGYVPPQRRLCFPHPREDHRPPKRRLCPPPQGGACAPCRGGVHTLSGIASHPCPSRRVQPLPQEKGVQDSLVSVQEQTSFNSRLFAPCRAVVPRPLSPQKSPQVVRAGLSPLQTILTIASRSPSASPCAPLWSRLIRACRLLAAAGFSEQSSCAPSAGPGTPCRTP